VTQTDRDLLGDDVDPATADFDTLDALDAQAEEDVRVLLSGLPARPGTRRA
jgi:hypothetical protein